MWPFGRKREPYSEYFAQLKHFRRFLKDEKKAEKTELKDLSHTKLEKLGDIIETLLKEMLGYARLIIRSGILDRGRVNIADPKYDESTPIGSADTIVSDAPVGTADTVYSTDKHNKIMGEARREKSTWLQTIALQREDVIVQLEKMRIVLSYVLEGVREIREKEDYHRIFIREFHNKGFKAERLINSVKRSQEVFLRFNKHINLLIVHMQELMRWFKESKKINYGELHSHVEETKRILIEHRILMDDLKHLRDAHKIALKVVNHSLKDVDKLEDQLERVDGFTPEAAKRILDSHETEYVTFARN